MIHWTKDRSYRAKRERGHSDFEKVARPSFRLLFLFPSFFTTFVVMSLWEAIAPRRLLLACNPALLVSNIGLLVLNSALERSGPRNL